MAFGRPFNHPFREAQPLTAIIGFPVSMDGRGYLIDRKQAFVRRQVPLLRTLSNPVGNETILLPPEVWRRARESWHMGSGQLMGDREESLPFRFHDSRGVLVWEKWQLSLLSDVLAVHESDVTGRAMVVWTNFLVVSEGTLLLWFTDLIGTAPTVVNFGTTILSITADGEGVIVALANGQIRKVTSSANTGVLLATLADVSFIAYVKDRLVAAALNVIYDITSVTDGSAVVIIPPRVPDPKVYQHPLASFRWIAAAEGLSCIYLLGGTGDRWVVHRLMLKDDATGLNPPIVSTQLPEGEVGYGLAGYLGYVCVGTQLGLRFGVPAANGDLTLGLLIPTKAPVRCFEGQGKFVWYGNTNPFNDWTGLGRLDLTTFTQPLSPAYANDLLTPGQGTVTSVVTFQNKRVFAVDHGGIYTEDSNKLVDEGWLTGGEFTYGVVDKKVALYAQLRFFAPMQGAVFIDVTYDAPDAYRQVAKFDVQGSLQGDNAFLNGTSFVKLEPRLRLRSRTTDHALGPRVSRWEIRAVPVSGKASEWVIPLIIADTVNVNGVTFARDVITDRDRLLALVETSRIFTYREGSRAWLVHALDFEWNAERESDMINGGWQGVFTIRIRELR